MPAAIFMANYMATFSANCLATHFEIQQLHKANRSNNESALNDKRYALVALISFHHIKTNMILSIVSTLAIVLLLAIGIILKHYLNFSCTLILDPQPCADYPEATNLIQLPQSFGYLVQYESNVPNVKLHPPTVLFVHSGRGNVNHYKDQVQSLLSIFSRVYVLEPRGFGYHAHAPHQDKFKHPSLASYLLAIRHAIDWLAQSNVPFDIVALGLGANMTRFMIKSFRLSSMRATIYIDPFSIEKLNGLVEWTKECVTGAYMEWSKLRQEPKHCKACND